MFYFSLLIVLFFHFVFSIDGVTYPSRNRTRSQTSAGRTMLTVCMFAERDTTGIIYDYNRAEAAVDMAVEYVNEYLFTNGYHIHIVDTDIGQECSGRNHIVGHAMSLLQRGIHCDVYVGPGCGLAAESLNDFAEFYDTPIIGCPAAGLGYSAPASVYTVTVRVSITYSTIADTLLRFFHHYNYTTPYFMEDTSINFFQQMSTLVKTTIQQRDPRMYYASVFIKFESRDLNFQKIRTLLSNGSDESRVFVIFGNADTIRMIMIVAESEKMTNGEFVFICVELYHSAVWGAFDWRRNDTYDEVARRAFQSLLILSIEVGVADETVFFWKKVIQYSLERYNYTIKEPEEIDPIVTHFYDAVVLYANLVNSMTASGLDFHNGVGMATFAAGYTFYSPINGNVTFNNDSDRAFNYKMKSLNAENEFFDTLFGFPASSDSGVNGEINVLGEIMFAGLDHLPPNMPRCGFKGESAICAAERNALRAGSLLAAIVVPVAIVLVSAVIAFICVRRYLNDHSDPYWWRILSYEMDFPADQIGGLSSKSLSKSSQKTLEDSKLNGKVAAEKEEDDEDSIDSVSPESMGTTAFYHGNSVSLLVLPEPRRAVPQNLPREAALVRSVLHGNVQKFIGVAISDIGLCEYIVGEVCQKGSLRDLLLTSTMELDWEFKNSLIKDISNGMTYLHASPVMSHGFLNDANCLVESRFVLKISGFGFQSLRDFSDLQPVIPSQTDRDFHSLLWRAPELLRRVMPPSGTPKGDVYSFAILLQQIILRSDPFQQRTAGGKKKFENLGPKEIIHEVRKGMTPPLRPPVPMSACSKGLHSLMENCWEEDPVARPAFVKIRTTAIKAIGRSGDNIVDYLIHQMERHAVELEHEVDKQMKQFMYERQRSADLLSVMLPKAVADALTKGVTILPETFDSTTVYFGDVSGFTEAIAQTTTPFGIVDILNGLYSVCDPIISDFDVFKVETVQDAYLIVSGLPVRNGKRHVEEICSMALALRKDIGTMKLDAAPKVSFKLRVGINSGSCVAGVIGSKMPRYCLFGDTVNTASRMESHGEAGKIHLSSTAYDLLKDQPDYIVVPRGVVNIKGKGPMDTFWLVGKTT